MITELLKKFGIHHTHSGVYAGDWITKPEGCLLYTSDAADE